MQKQFNPPAPVIEEVMRQVVKAKNNKEWIFLLEYQDMGRTLHRISRLLKDYTKWLKLIKTNDDGSADVLYGLNRIVSNPKINSVQGRITNIKVVGVNTSACVVKTVRGLSMLDSRVNVIEKGCANGDLIPKNGMTPQQLHKYHFSLMKKWKNVNVC